MLCKAGDREAKAKMAYEENISFESDAEDLLWSIEWRQKIEVCWGVHSFVTWKRLRSQQMCLQVNLGLPQDKLLIINDLFNSEVKNNL